jgi:competence protein ComEA
MRRFIRTQSLLFLAAVLALAASMGHAASASAASRVAQSYLVGHALDGKLNVNTATPEQWELLPGIGPAIAARVIAYRSQRPFTHVSHVMRVKGIGRKTYSTIRPFLTLDGETTLRIADDRPPPETSRLPPSLPPLPSLPFLP